MHHLSLLDHQRWKVAGLALHLVSLLVLAPGCSQEKLNEVVASVKEKAAEVNAQARQSEVLAEILPATGNAEVQMTPPVSTKIAYVRLESVDGGRPRVVQWTTYNPENGPNSYPAILVRATTEASNIESLAQQSLRGDVYIQATEDATVWTNRKSEPVAIAVSAVNTQDKTLGIAISSVTLVSPEGEEQLASSIRIQGALP